MFYNIRELRAVCMCSSLELSSSSVNLSVSARVDFDNRVVAAVAFGASVLSESMCLTSRTRTSAILYYDFLLTIAAEVERFWKGRLSWVSAALLANRYLSALSHIPVVFQFFATLPNSVRHPRHLTSSLSLCQS